MKIFPDYYSSFRCIADKCTHNCCIGWEIDIDADTLSFYEGLASPLGDEIRCSIDRGETPHFRLTEDERCPHLDSRGLCRIISTLGEDGVCEICREHPRFRNFYGAIEEVGLGLCCEEACRLILRKDTPTKLVSEKGEIDTSRFSEEEKRFFYLRERSFELLQNRDATLCERIEAFLKLWDADLSDVRVDCFVDFLLSLERLDERWGELLCELKKSPYGCLDEINVCLPGCSAEQLLVYFAYRHLSGAVVDGNCKGRARLCVMLFYVVRALCAVLAGDGDVSFETVCEAARMLSSELEYSEDNLDELLFELCF